MSLQSFVEWGNDARNPTYELARSWGRSRYRPNRVDQCVRDAPPGEAIEDATRGAPDGHLLVREIGGHPRAE